MVGPRRRLAGALRLLAGVAVVVAAAAGGLAANALLFGSGQVAGGGSSAAPSGMRSSAVSSALTASARRLARLGAGAPRGEALIATARGMTVAVYRAPGQARPWRLLGELPFSYGTKLVFVVERVRGGWLKVQLPVRPNLSSGWIEARSVLLTTTPYRVVVLLRSHRMIVFDGRRAILRAPIGVGRAVSPTPSGRYFITDLLEPRDPAGVYGPYAFGLSAYSNVYTTFAGGDGQIGLHGTDYPAGIGTDVSHGCIRTYNAVIRKLAALLPLGTPVTILRR